MTTVWRISKASLTRQAFSGIGAQRFGGRWNSKGHLVVYAADSLALAILEVLVHLPRPRHLRGQHAASVKIPNSLIQDVGKLPRGWRRNTRLTQAIGDAWIRSMSSPAMAVPSVLYEYGSVKPINYLLNPNHTAFSQLGIGRFASLNMDPRIA